MRCVITYKLIFVVVFGSVRRKYVCFQPACISKPRLTAHIRVDWAIFHHKVLFQPVEAEYEYGIVALLSGPSRAAIAE
jgi:hypothetical protein